MKRSDNLKEISKQLKLSYEDQGSFTDFLESNDQLNDDEFYKKFESTLLWVKYKFKSQNLAKQNSINNHLLFFKVIVIISLVIGVLSVFIPWLLNFILLY